MDMIPTVSLSPVPPSQASNSAEVRSVNVPEVMNSDAHQVVQGLLHFIETRPNRIYLKDKQAWLQATDYLFKLVKRTSSTRLLALLYHCCGWTYAHLGEGQLALTNFEHALELHSRSANTYNGLGYTHFDLKEYQQAIDAFNHALQLVSFQPDYYVGRGKTYGKLNAYQQALSDFDHALQLDERNLITYVYRGLA
jgi:tetratricopeptide (TPR) repeat protein